MLKNLMEKADNNQEQMDNVSREIEIPRKNQNKMLEIKYTTREMKNVFDELIHRLDTADERISEPEDMTTETSKNEKRLKTNTNTTEYPRTVGQLHKL